MAETLAADPWASLTPRESELLKKAGERVFELSKRVTEHERTIERLKSENEGLRELLAESREVRAVLVAQVTSLQTGLDREYEERSELRRLMAGLHMQMQELLPVVTGLSQTYGEAPRTRPPQSRIESAPRRRPGVARQLLSSAAGEIRKRTRGKG